MACVMKSTMARAWLQGAAIVAMAVALLATGARAETIGGALAKAYLNNPDINQQRAAVRVQDENIPKANAGYMPNVSAEGDAAMSNTLASGLGAGYPNPLDVSSRPRGYGVTVTQNVWNGDRTGNSVRQAESGVFGAREQLRNTEQNVLLSAVELLHGRDARHGDPRTRPQQRRGVAGAAAPDPGPLQRRRGDAHRRRAGRGESRRRARHRARRAIAIAGLARQLSPGDRRRSEEPDAQSRR